MLNREVHGPALPTAEITNNWHCEKPVNNMWDLGAISGFNQSPQEKGLSACKGPTSGKCKNFLNTDNMNVNLGCTQSTMGLGVEWVHVYSMASGMVQMNSKITEKLQEADRWRRLPPSSSM